MGTFTIKDTVSNLLPEGNYDIRFEEFTPKVSANNNNQIVIKGKVVGGPNDGQVVFLNRTIRADIIGILSRDLAATQAFDESEDLSDDHNELARQLESKLGGKVFACSYKHGKPSADGRVFPDIAVIGPTAGAFA